MRWRGPKTRGWEKALRQLNKQFLEWGIIHCELRYFGCRINKTLAYAHALKRSQHPEMYRSDELKRVILACNHCHDIIEAKPAAEMEAIVDRVIELRWKILSFTQR